MYVKQPPNFKNHAFSNHVFKLNDVLYGLKQAPCAWYERFNIFLLDNNFTRKNIDTNLVLKKKR